MDGYILAGDIGGTKSNVACFEAAAGGRLALSSENTLATQDFENFEALLAEFLGERCSQVRAACFGVAGPVEGQRVELTNVPMGIIDAATISAHLGGIKVALINDMVAMAWGALTLGAECFHVLNPGCPGASGNAALIAAGTGLGEALMHWDGQRYLPSPSEGGHVDFAPTSELEIDLLRYLRALYGRVSYERILSGPGIVNVYNFLKETGRAEEPPWLAEQLRQENPAAVISRGALDDTAPICQQAIDLFVRIYGAEAGNMALKALAIGGIFVGGGIAPKILPELSGRAFMESFNDKGRLGDVMEKIPVKVILEPKAPLYGAAHYASML